MDEKRSQLAEELRQNPEIIQNLMRSRDGQMLAQLLSRDGEGFRRALQSAVRGDSAEMAERIRQIAENPDGAALLARIRRAVER